MSLQFSDTTNSRGIVQLIDRLVKTNRASYPLADIVTDVNLAMDDALGVILKAQGTWQFDDSNHTDYPIITTNLVSGQRDYTFSGDQNGNLILEIYKVYVKDSSGIYQEILPVDVSTPQETVDTSSFTDGQNLSGKPYRYDKIANGILLDPVPNYNSTAGLKIYISREPSYFTTSDTTKKPGFAGIFHQYLAYKAAYQYALLNGLSTTQSILNEVVRLEEAMKAYYSKRTRDERPRMKEMYQNNK